MGYGAGLDRGELAICAGSVGLPMADAFMRHDRTGQAAAAVPGMVRALEQAALAWPAHGCGSVSVRSGCGSLPELSFTRDLRDHAGQARISEDIDSAALSGVHGIPTFFINGKRQHGVFDLAALSGAVRAGRARTLILLDRRERRDHGQDRGAH